MPGARVGARAGAGAGRQVGRCSRQGRIFVGSAHATSGCCLCVAGGAVRRAGACLEWRVQMAPQLGSVAWMIQHGTMALVRSMRRQALPCHLATRLQLSFGQSVRLSNASAELPEDWLASAMQRLNTGQISVTTVIRLSSGADRALACAVLQRRWAEDRRSPVTFCPAGLVVAWACL